MVEQVCGECDYFAGQTENMALDEDKKIHQEIDHYGKPVVWLEFWQR